MLGKAELDRVKGFMLQVFDAFDVWQIGEVETRSITCGFLLLVSGSKSEKLEWAFRLFSSNRDSMRLNRSDLFLMIRSLLCMLCMFSDSSSDSFSFRSIESSATELATAAVSYASSSDDGDSVTFEEFAQWYNEGGCHEFSWIELLDPTKWSWTEPLKDPENIETLSGANKVTFSLTNRGNTVVISSEHSELVRKAARITSLGSVSVVQFAQACVEELYPLATRASQGNDTLLIDKSAFDNFIRALIPGESLSKEEKSWLSGLFNTIFWLESHRSRWFTESPDKVSANGIAAALSLFLFGNKSEKLTFAFAVFCGDDIVKVVQNPVLADHDMITAKSMEKMIGALLVPVVSATISPARGGFTEWGAVITECARELMNELLLAVGKTSDEILYFDDFRKWYNEQGYEKASWLELIAFHKWPFYSAPEENSQATLSLPKVSEQVAFPFAILGVPGRSAFSAEPARLTTEAPSLSELDRYNISHPDESGFLFITHDDCRALRDFIRITRLDSHDVETLQTILIDRSSYGHLSESSFHKVMRRLIDTQSLHREETVFASRALDRIFMAFDRSSAKEVSVWEFTIGLGMFASGSKSEKLSAAWTLLDSDDDNALKKIQLWRLLRSFLTGVVIVKYFLVDHFSSEELSVLCDDIDVLCVQLTEQIVQYCCGKGGDGNFITFEQFGEWYNEKGYQVTPWLELLDLRKWPKDNDIASSPKDREKSIKVSSPDRNSEPVETDETLSFQLSSSGDMLSLTESDIFNVSKLLNLSKLGTIEAPRAVDILLEECTGEVLTKSDFNKAMKKLIQVSELNAEDKRFLSLSLNTFFFAFDQDCEESVDSNEFITGFLLLCGGSKSEKLAVAWELMDSDSDGSLNRLEFFALMKSLLRGIMALEGEAQRAAPHTIEKILDDTCGELVELVFGEAHVDDSGLSFDNFGEYYNKGGYEKMAWLELLNLSKWGDVVSDSLQGNTAQDSAHYDDSGDNRDEEAILCVFDFSTLPPLTLSRPAAELFLAAVSSSGLNVYSVDDFWTKLRRQLGGNTLSADLHKLPDQDQLIEGIQQLIQVSAKNSRSNFYSDMALDYFSIWVRFLLRVGINTFLSFQLASMWVCDGTKSEKLRKCWEAFGKDRLDLKGLGQLLSCLLGSLYYFARILRVSTEMLKSSASTVAESILKDTDSRTISFEEFGHWYNNGGYNRTAWLELLDLTKWYQCLEAEEVSALPESASTDNEPKSLSLELCEVNGLTEHFTIDPERLNRISGAFSHAPISQITINQLADYVSRNMSAQPDFDDQELFVSLLVPIMTSGEDEIFAVDFCHLLYDFVHQFHHGRLSVLSFLCVTSPFCFGNKSDKLAYLLTDEGDGLNMEELEFILKGCLSGVASMFLFLEQHHPQKRRKQSIFSKMGAALDAMLTSIKENFEVEKLNYQTFGVWYNRYGPRFSPWLEYMDPKKWLYSEASPRLDSGAAQKSSESVVGKSGPEDTSEQDMLHVFSFTFGNNVFLQIDSNSSHKVVSLVNSTKFQGQSVLKLHEIVSSLESEDGNVHADAVKLLLDVIIPNSSDASLAKKFMSRVFYCLDNDSETRGVDAMEFSVALSLLCGGPKSEKLRAAFMVLGEGEKNEINDAQLWRLLVALLIGVGCAASLVYAAPEDIPTNFVVSAPNGSLTVGQQASDSLMSQAFAIVRSLGKDQPTDIITFEEFASWYNRGGARDAPWLELLDVRKWPTAAGQALNGDGNHAGKNVFEFSLSTTDTAPKTAVAFSSNDCIARSRFFKVSGLNELDIDALEQAARNCSSLNSKKGYNYLLRSLIPGSSIGEKEKIFLSYHLNRIYQQLSSLFVKLEKLHVVCALVVLCRGSKSSKLNFCWTQALQEGSDRVDTLGLFSIFASYLCAITSFSEKFFNNAEGNKIVADHVRYVVDILGNLHPDGVRFEDFVDWYNTNGGFSLIPWLEFIDTRKWPESYNEQLESKENDANEYSFPDEDEDLGDDSVANTSGNLDVPVFVFEVSQDEILSIERETIRFTIDDAVKIDSLRRALNSEVINDPARLEKLLAEGKSHPPNTEENILQYDKVARSIAQHCLRENIAASDGSFCMGLIEKLVSFCQLLGQAHTPSMRSDSVFAEEVACALIVLSDNKKSQKLLVAFKEFGRLSGSKAFEQSHRLSENDVGRFFASLFLALLVLGSEYRESGSPERWVQLSLSIGRDVARDIARTTVSTLLEPRISYSHVVEWYNTKGYLAIPWLELIDLSKWEQSAE